MIQAFTAFCYMNTHAHTHTHTHTHALRIYVYQALRVLKFRNRTENGDCHGEESMPRQGREGGPGRGWESLDGLTGHFLRWMQNWAAGQLHCTVNVLITIQAYLHTHYFYLILNMAMNKGV